MEVKRGLKNNILSTLMYGLETKKWNRAQQSRVHDVKMSYLRGPCCVTRWEDESNESVYERCCIKTHANGVKCGVVKRYTVC